MTLPTHIQEAIRTINQYREQIEKTITPSSHLCICCKQNKIERLGPGGGHPLKQEELGWNNGTVEKVNFGWGSNRDMESFYVAICDSCITKLEKEGMAINLDGVKNKLREIDFTFFEK